MMGGKLAEYRRKANLTQEKLALITGVSQSAISNYEKGKRTPERQHLRKLARVLGCRPHDLVEKGDKTLHPRHLLELTVESALESAKTEESRSRIKIYAELMEKELPPLPSEEIEEDLKTE